MKVLVTGGRGMLGSYLVPRLIARGHEVRILTRRPATADGAGAEVVTGDVVTGDGLDAATEGTEAVVHAATKVGRGMRTTEVEGTRRVISAAGDAHLIYVSIVGVDRHRFPYYRCKWAAEQVVETSGRRWTIQRATQFHDLIDGALSLPLFPTTAGLAFQTVDAGDVSDRLADLVDQGPAGRATDLGGPEVLTMTTLRDERRRIRGSAARLLRVPRLGFMKDFDAGLHTCGDHADGTSTWTTWQEGRARP